MKIAAIAGARVPSDTANSIQVMKACQALVQLGHDLTLLVPAPASDRAWEELAAFYGLATSFEIQWIGTTSRRVFTWQAVQRARQFQPDLVYTWMPQSAVFSLVYRLPTVFEIHIQPTGLFGPLWHWLFARLPGRKCLMSITRALQEELERDFGMRMKPDKVVITPNGVELERFENLPDPGTARRQLNLVQAPTVACTGHLYAGRGVELFLALAARAPEAHFLWVGGRPQDVDSWQEQARTGGLTNVTFTGFVPNQALPVYQAAADILLMPYGREIAGSSGGNSASVCSPMKMFEYMAAGRAVITSDLPVLHEVMNEKNAVFCNPGDVEDWARAVKRLLSDENLRSSLAVQAQQDVKRFTWRERARRALSGFGKAEL
ncbi:MAG: glycosyltransferase [Anaerolineales bacterium]|nr:glycosyltransferase [Anaerolineales bacterium]